MTEILVYALLAAILLTLYAFGANRSRHVRTFHSANVAKAMRRRARRTKRDPWS